MKIHDKQKVEIVSKYYYYLAVNNCAVWLDQIRAEPTE